MAATFAVWVRSLDQPGNWGAEADFPDEILALDYMARQWHQEAAAAIKQISASSKAVPPGRERVCLPFNLLPAGPLPKRPRRRRG